MQLFKPLEDCIKRPHVPDVGHGTVETDAALLGSSLALLEFFLLVMFLLLEMGCWLWAILKVCSLYFGLCRCS